MTSYNAVGVVDVSPTARRADMWIESLAGYSPAVGRTDDGRAEITITVEATFFELAAATALQLLTHATGSLSVFEVLTTAEFDRRTAAIEPDDLVDTQTAASMLGVSRQRIQQLHASGQLPGRKIGNALALSLVGVQAFASARDGIAPGQHGPTGDYGTD